MAGEKPGKKQCKAYPIGYSHLDIAAVRTAEGKLHLCVAVDRACTFAYAEWHAEANTMVAAQFLRNLITAIAYKSHTVLTDHGIPFTNRKRDIYAFHQIFARVYREHGIDHRLTKTTHPWTNGQVERMNRTLNEATVTRSYDATHDHLKEQLPAFLMADNVAKRLKTLNGLTPDEYICQCWQKEPERFTVNPGHHTLGLNS